METFQMIDKPKSSADRQLAAQVLIQALLDLHANNARVRAEARAFLFGTDQSHTIVRTYWLRSAGIKVERVDHVKGLTLDELRVRMADQARWRAQRRAMYRERTRRAA